LTVLQFLSMRGKELFHELGEISQDGVDTAKETLIRSLESSQEQWNSTQAKKWLLQNRESLMKKGLWKTAFNRYVALLDKEKWLKKRKDKKMSEVAEYFCKEL